jgi:glycerate-2-kinase
LVIVLISGGGSALLVDPADGLTLEDQLIVIRRLSGGGADINQLNTVRKHLSGVKGGGLARACRDSSMVSLILSDVLGDPLDLIASGPTVADPSSAEDALTVLKKFDLDQTLPDSVYRCLRSKTEITQPLTQIQRVATLVIGNNAVAVDAAGIQAESLGYNHVMKCARQSEGEAEVVGRHLAEMTLEMLRRDPTQHRQDALITGGEPTVTLANENERGKGGRNQQLVLAAYERLLELNLSPKDWNRLVILSGGTDGEDGPTDAAGAWIDAAVHASAVAQNLLPESFLNRNDAYSFFQATGGLLMTGPTATNVCDIRVALVESSEESPDQ